MDEFQLGVIYGYLHAANAPSEVIDIINREVRSVISKKNDDNCINQMLDAEVSCLDLSTRARNVIRSAGWNIYEQKYNEGEKIETIRDLVRHTKSSLLKIPNCGFKTIKHINQELQKHGFALGLDV